MSKKLLISNETEEVVEDIWDGVTYLPGRQESNTWGTYNSSHTANWSSPEKYSIEFDITSSSLRGPTILLEGLTPGSKLTVYCEFEPSTLKYLANKVYYYTSDKTCLSNKWNGGPRNIKSPLTREYTLPDNCTCVSITFQLEFKDSTTYPYPQHALLKNINFSIE